MTDDVVSAAITGFSHLQDRRAVPRILEFVDHPSEDVRLNVAMSLRGATDYEPHEGAIEALVKLSADEDEDVRNWACFGLGQFDADTPEAREALAARLDDEHNDTRCEAVSALARIDDERAVAYLLEHLQGDRVFLLEIEAAAACADPRLEPLLVVIKGWWEDDGDMHVIDDAIARCSSDAHAKAAEVEQRDFQLQTASLEKYGLRLERAKSYPFTEFSVYRNDVLLDVERLWDNLMVPGALEVSPDPDEWAETISRLS